MPHEETSVEVTVTTEAQADRIQFVSTIITHFNTTKDISVA